MTTLPPACVPLTASFVRGAMAVQDFPPLTYPEIAFVGRSNVGKSSLINGLLNRKKLAHISKKPGKTAQINFFNVADRFADRFVLVDMPGYGYAAVSQKMRQLWGSLIPAYFNARESWTHTFILIDSRHPPQKTDLQVIAFFTEHSRPFTCVLTKSDKISRALLEERMQALENLLHGAPFSGIFPFSVKNNEMIEQLRSHLLNTLP